METIDWAEPPSNSEVWVRVGSLAFPGNPVPFWCVLINVQLAMANITHQALDQYLLFSFKHQYMSRLNTPLFAGNKPSFPRGPQPVSIGARTSNQVVWSCTSPQINPRTPLWKDLSLLICFLILKDLRGIHNQPARDLELNLVAISGLASLPPFLKTPFLLSKS